MYPRSFSPAGEEKKGADADDDEVAGGQTGTDDFVPQSPPRSSGAASRDEMVSTPTDFTVDYGKGSSATSFDTSNVLAWLQSPTAHGLFSPGGGLGSLMNTPAGGAPRTPRTPTVSTSFFFSDVASLPKTDEESPKESSGSKKQKNEGISNIICISPLASTKGRGGLSSHTNTPMNFKDIFASPNERGRSLPLLGDTPSRQELRGKARKSTEKKPSLDAVHLAERDLLEDEDLSVLLQLASNTPAANTAEIKSPVFRSPKGDDDKFPNLELPMIGNDGDAGKGARLSQKTDRLGSKDFGPPTLGMRSSSVTSAKDVSTSVKNSSKVGQGDKPDEATSSGDKPSAVVSSTSTTGKASAYPAHPYGYYPMSGMPPVPPGATGSMRVVVGAPPARRNGKNGSPQKGEHHAPYHEYPHPPGTMPPYPPPPPGMFGAYPPYSGMGRYPYSHYPPPPARQMAMYGSQHSAASSSSTAAKENKRNKPSAKAVAAKMAGAKRSLSTSESKAVPVSSNAASSTVSANNKKKKQSSGGPPKKKNRSPQLTDRADRDKAAATIHSVNAASGGKNDKAAALAAAILRGVTMRPSGKWQAQLYFAGKSRYIGVFDTREKAALAYEIAREKLKSGPEGGGALTPKSTENLVNAARKAAFEGVNERLPK